MRFAFTLCILLFAALCSRAQDVIVLTSNAEIKGKVISVDSATVTYRNNNSDIIHKLPKNAVISIRYSDGSQTIIHLPNMADRVTADSIKHINAYADYTTLARKRTRAGIILSAMGAPLILGGTAVIVLGAYKEKQSSTLPDSLRSAHGRFFIYAMGSVLVAGGVGLEATGMSMFLTAKKYCRKAREIKTLLSFNPTVQPIPRAGNVYGSYTGLAMRVTF